MRKTFARRYVRCENGEPAALQYRILEEAAGGITRYGAEIVMRRGGKEERAAVRDLSLSYDSVRDFLRLLANGSVTPCTLREIVEDRLNNS